MYDWANSVYSLVITSAIFPIYFESVTTTDEFGDKVSFFGLEIVNTVLYSYALSFSFLFVAAILPILSGVADYGGKKKFFMKIFVYLGGAACIGLYFFEGANVEWAIICSILASVGYSGSLVFYDAFLPEIASSDRFDKVSARGYSMGYLGSVLLLIVNLVMIEMYDTFGFADKGVASRFAFLTVGLWWIGFSQITFARIPESAPLGGVKSGLWKEGYKELNKVWQNLKQMSVLKKYLMAFFFYNTGVQTVMYLAASFGSKELKMESGELILTVLIINLVAIGGAYGFAYLSKKKGNVFSIITMVFIWIGICIGAYFVNSSYEFYTLAFVVGLVMGGIQSLSRATYAKLIPEGTPDRASFFSFYDVTYNVSIVVGTFSYGLVEQITGSMRNSVLVLMIFFAIGLVFLRQVKIARTKQRASA